MLKVVRNMARCIATNLSLTSQVGFGQVPYSKFIFGLKEDNVLLDRKVLSQLAAHEPYSFKALVDRASHMALAGQQAREEASKQGLKPPC